MKKLSLPLVVVALFCSNANANDTQIITDDFVVTQINHNNPKHKKCSSNHKTTAKYLGLLGDFWVVEGNKDPSDIAFVIDQNGTNKIIKNTILVKCKKFISCVPNDLEPTTITSGFYKIEVANYTDWKNAIDRLNNSFGVTNVAPTFFYGQQSSVQ